MPNTKLRDWRIAKWAQNAVYSAINQAKILTGYAPNVVIPSAEHNELFNQASVAIAELQTAGTLLYNDQLAMVKGSIFAVVESGEVKLRQCIADQASGFNPDPGQNSNVLPFPNALSAAEVSASVQVDSNVFPAVNGATVQAQIQQLVQRTAFLRNTAGRNLPVGALMFTAAETADQGWLALTESTQLVSVTQYPEAFAKLGTRFGGNGTTTFGLPTIAEGRALLFNGSSASGTVTTGEVKAHTHTISGPMYAENGSVANHIAEGSGNPTTTFSFETTSTGGSANLAAGVKFLLCIKMFDILSANHYEPAEGGNYIWPEKVVSLGSVSGDVELDFSAGTVFEMTVTDDVIFSAENAPVPGLTYEFGLRIVNGGAHSITWPDGWSVEGTLSADGISIVQGYVQSTSCTAWVMYAASSSSVAALIADLANKTDPAKGAGMVGYKGSTQYARNEAYDQVELDVGQITVDLTKEKLRHEFAGGFYEIFNQNYPSTSSHYVSEPTLVEMENQKVIAFFRVGDGHQASDGGTGYLCAKTFDPATNTWGALQTIAATTGYDSRNQIAFKTNTGRIVLLYYKCQMAGGEVVEATRSTVLRYSDDNGETWSAEDNFSQFCPYPTLDNVPFGKAIVFADGKITVTVYNYHTFFALSSTDNGVTWGNRVTIYTTPVLTDDNYTEPTLVKVDEARIVCIARVISSGQTRVGSAVFEYQGRSWVTATNYTKGMRVCNSGHIYEATTSGVSGPESASPYHTSGIVSDGGVEWLHIAPYVNWTDSTTYTQGQYVRTYYTYAYRVSTAGTVGTTAPNASVLPDEEGQFIVYRSSDAGVTWDSGERYTWSVDSFQATVSPPSPVVDGDTLHFVWFARSPRFALYKTSVPLCMFYNSPELAIGPTQNPRQSLALSALVGHPDAYGYRVDCGYVSAIKLSFADKLMLCWYDNPTVTVGNTALYAITSRP